jgi:hypothetical protein
MAHQTPEPRDYLVVPLAETGLDSDWYFGAPQQVIKERFR